MLPVQCRGVAQLHPDAEAISVRVGSLQGHAADQDGSLPGVHGIHSGVRVWRQGGCVVSERKALVHEMQEGSSSHHPQQVQRHDCGHVQGAQGRG